VAAISLARRDGDRRAGRQGQGDDRGQQDDANDAAQPAPTRRELEREDGDHLSLTS
jgi:hypothetical protein